MTSDQMPTCPFAWQDPSSGLWLTGQQDLFERWELWSQTWPRWAMTRRGQASQPPWLGRAIAASGCSSSPGPLLRTPLASDGDRGPETLEHVLARGAQVAITHQLAHLAANPEPGKPWGRYQPAADHWAEIIGRRPPTPGLTSENGTVRANPAALEWMMGLPEGWVTDPALGLSRRRQIKALGNGVVPQQAVHALTILLRAAE